MSADREIEVRLGAGSAEAGDVSGLKRSSHPSLLRSVHRCLRGRYPWAIALSMVCGLAGAWAGWRSQEPLYRSEGVINVTPTLPSVRDPLGQSVLPMFRAFVSLQVQILGSMNTTLLAMEQDAWRETGRGMSPRELERFIERRAIVNNADDQFILVQFTDEDPGVALAGVMSVIAAYEKSTAEQNTKDERLTFAASRVDAATASLKSVEDRLEAALREVGSEEILEMRRRATAQQLFDAETELRKGRDAILELEEGGSVVAEPEPTPKTARELAAVDARLASELLEVSVLEAKIRLREKSVGEMDSGLLELRSELEQRKGWLAETVDLRNAQEHREWERRRGTEVSGDRGLARLKRRVDLLEARIAAAAELGQRMGDSARKIRELRVSQERLARELDEATAVRDELSAQLLGRGRIQILSRGQRPTLPTKDRRLATGLLLGLLGAGAGLLAVLLRGSFDPRFNSSADVGASFASLRLLGLMPFVPPELVDAQHAELASHSAHQIRTVLQIDRDRADGGCLCVTGPAAGSGKTTVTLALGRSFAQTGTRTLLIDADLDGRGLTRRVADALLTHVRALVEDFTTTVESRRVGGAAWERGLVPLVASQAATSRVGLGDVEELVIDALQREGSATALPGSVLSELLSAASLSGGRVARDRLADRIQGVVAGRGVEHQDRNWTAPLEPVELTRAHQQFNGVPLDHYIFPTGQAGLSLLPLRGLGEGGDVSVATIARILARVRAAYDVVLVDTGPVLGSVETQIVAANADGVVFVVSPQDHRPMAERAANHLREIGARMAGVVFNRASPGDVLRSSRSSSGRWRSDHSEA